MHCHYRQRFRTPMPGLFKDLAECWWDLAELWMRSSRVVRAFSCQCQSRNSPESSEGRQMKQGWTTYIKRKNQKNPPFKVWYLVRQILRHRLFNYAPSSKAICLRSDKFNVCEYEPRVWWMLVIFHATRQRAIRILCPCDPLQSCTVFRVILKYIASNHMKNLEKCTDALVHQFSDNFKGTV